MPCSENFPFSSGLQSRKLITSVTCYCNLFLKKQCLFITLGRQPAGQGLTTPSQAARQGFGGIFPHIPRGRGLLWQANLSEVKMHSGPLYKHPRVGFGPFRTAAPGQHCWKRRTGWSCTAPGGVGTTAQRPASSQLTGAYICCHCTSS